MDCPNSECIDGRVVGEDGEGLSLCPDCLNRNKRKNDNKGDEYCQWKYDEWHDKWDTECGQGHQFMEGGPRENHHVYCPYCGKRIMAIKTNGGE